MTKSISNSLLSRLSEIVSSQAGLYFPKEKWQDLERGVKATAKELNFKDTESFVQRLLTSHTLEQINTLVGNLTIGETFFFRDKHLFQILQDRLISGWIRAGAKKERDVKIWSAACCSGEEPYSIAILIDQMGQALKDWKFTIQASDINPSFLKKAEKGVYSRWSFRGTPDIIVKKYFNEIGKNDFEIAPHIKKKAQFFKFNLADKGCHPSMRNIQEMDVIFCRNVLMYFSEETRQRVIQNLFQTLRPGGWLIVGASETAFVSQPGLHAVQFPGVILHRKGSPRKGDPDKIEVEPKTRISFTFKDLDRRFIKAISRPSARQPLLEIDLRKTDRRRKRQEDRKSKANQVRRQADKISEEKPAKSIQDVYQEALKLYEKRRYKESAEKLTEYFSQGKVSTDSFLMNSESMALLGSALANLGQLDEAKKWCEQAVNAEKLRPGYYYLLASIYQEEGNLNESKKLLKRAIYLDSKFVMAYFVLGNLAQKQDRLDEAQKHLKNTLSLLGTVDPDEIMPHSEGMTAGRLAEVVRLMLSE